MFRHVFESKVRKGNLTYLVSILIMVIMPLNYRYLPPFMILLGITWIFENYSSLGEQFSNSSMYKLLFLLFVMFYLWQITGLLYSSDLKMGWSNAFGRLSLVVFPLIFFNVSEKIKANTFILLRIFAVSTLCYLVSCFGYALFRSLNIHGGTWVFNPHPPEYEWINYFYGTDFAYSIHPSYLAMFVLLSAFVAFESWYDHSLKRKWRIIWIVIGIFFLISVYFISSRAAILAMLILILFFTLDKIIRYKNNRLIGIGVIVFLILLLPFLKTNDRVNNLLSKFSFKRKIEIRDQDDRIIIWESALKIIRKNIIWGVGIGDVRSELVNEYESRGETKLSEERLNAHNQFLEVLLENGIIGLLIFLGIFGYMIFIAISEKNLLYGLFIIMISVFFMFETVLYRLAGVSFFSLFSFLLLHIPKKPAESY